MIAHKSPYAGGVELDFEGIRSALDNANWHHDIDTGNDYRAVWLGTIYALTPSGKAYAPWTSNATDEEMEADQVWWENANEAAERLGFEIDTGPESPDDVFACEYRDMARRKQGRAAFKPDRTEEE